jgi:hypothetical protein
MTGVDPGAAGRFLTTVFEPEDWVAIFLKSYESGGVAQRVGPVSWIQSERFRRWLLAMNSRKYNVFVSVNAIASGRHSRTRESIGAVRHVFFDADHDGPEVLCRVDARRDLPSPNYVLHSSPNRVHLFWRVTDFDCESVEHLQKQLASELQTDPVVSNNSIQATDTAVGRFTSGILGLETASSVALIPSGHGSARASASVPAGGAGRLAQPAAARRH